MRCLQFQVSDDVALMLERQQQGRKQQPTVAVREPIGVKAPGAAAYGDDAHKKVTGRQRHIAVAADGRLLRMNLAPADLADSTGAESGLLACKKRWPWSKHLFAKAADDRRRLLVEAVMRGCGVEVVRNS